MAQLGAGGVEWDRVLWELGRRREDELGVGVDVSLDEPCRRNAIDMRTRSCHPPTSVELGQIQCRPLVAAHWFRGSSTHSDDLLETPHLGPSGSPKEIDVSDALVVFSQPRQLLLDPRALRR